MFMYVYQVSYIHTQAEIDNTIDTSPSLFEMYEVVNA